MANERTGPEPAVGPGAGPDAAPARQSGRGRNPGRRSGSEAQGGPPADPESVARTICLRLLTGQDRSRAELADRLHRRHIPDDAAERVLDRLTAAGLIDDAAYAESFVRSRHEYRGLGRGALRMELRRKGIDRDLADRAVEAIDDDAERDRAAQLVTKKLDSAVLAGLPAARRRLLGMLARRGYTPSIAIEVVNEALDGFVEPMDQPTDDDPFPDTTP